MFTKVIAFFMSIINVFSLMLAAYKSDDAWDLLKPFWLGGRMRITEIDYQEDSVYFDADGVACLLQFSPPHGWRLRTAENGKFDDYGAGQTLARDLGEAIPNAVETLQYNASDSSFTAPDGSRAQVKKGKGIVFYTPSGAQAYNIDVIYTDKSGNLHVAGDLDKKERLYGTGERFDYVDQRGQRVEIYALDKWLQISNHSYVPIPIVTSSRGCGLFMNRYEHQILDLGHYAKNRYDFEVSSGPADLYVFATENVSDVLYGYSVISGFAPEPAEWLYGTQVCRKSPDFSTPEGVYEMARKMEENDFPWEAVILEGFSAFNKNRWADLQEIADFVHSKGKKVMVYQAAGEIFGDIDAYFGTKNEYLMHTAEGSVNLPYVKEYGVTSGTKRYVDMTSPSALDWWFNDIWGEMTQKFGIDGAKIDFCEQVPDQKLALADGIVRTGTHHWYPVLYNTMMYNYFNQRPEGGMNLSRGGGIGAQRYPFLWAGDQEREFAYLQAILKACLSAGLSGVPFMSYDMSAYRATDNARQNPEAEVFVRGLEYTCFSANIQTHGNVTRPYDFDDATKNLYRIYANMHDAMRPYLVEYGKIASETAMPLMRALILYDQNDDTCADTWDEYMLGDAFLVAPVLEKGKTARNVYLPQGEWTDIYTGEVYSGGRTLKNYATPLSKLPVFVNNNSGSAALGETLSAMQPYIAEINELCK